MWKAPLCREKHRVLIQQMDPTAAHPLHHGRCPSARNHTGKDQTPASSGNLQEVSEQTVSLLLGYHLLKQQFTGYNFDLDTGKP